MQGGPAAALLVRLPGPAGARIIAPNLRDSTAVGSLPTPEVCLHPLAWLKVAIERRDPSSDPNDQLLAPVRIHGLLIRPHARVGVVLMRQRQNRHQPTAMIFILQEFGPVLLPQRHATHEPVRPIIRVGDAVIVLEQQRQKHITGLQGLGNPAPMAHDEVEDAFELLLARKGVLVRHVSSPDLGQVLARVDKAGAADQGGEEAIQLFKVQRSFAVKPVESTCEAVAFSVREWACAHVFPSRPSLAESDAALPALGQSRPIVRLTGLVRRVRALGRSHRLRLPLNLGQLLGLGLKLLDDLRLLLALSLQLFLNRGQFGLRLVPGVDRLARLVRCGCDPGLQIGQGPRGLLLLG